jgi:hypothetical protein
MNYELIAVLIVMFLYWFLNLRKENVVSVSIPVEKMSNVSIFDGNI